MLTRQGAAISQAHGQDGHQGLISHRVDDAANNSLEIPAARDPAVEQVRDARVREQAQRPDVGVVEDGVADEGRGHEAREREEVGHRVDVLVWR